MQQYRNNPDAGDSLFNVNLTSPGELFRAGNV